MIYYFMNQRHRNALLKPNKASIRLIEVTVKLTVSTVCYSLVEGKF